MSGPMHAVTRFFRESIGSWLTGLAWWQWVLVPSGIVIVYLGIRTLANGRASVKRESSRDDGRADRTSVPTTLASGLAQLALGAHLIAWTLPAHVQGPFAPVDRWWIVVLVCGAMVGLSLALDQLDAPRPRDTDPDARA